MPSLSSLRSSLSNVNSLSMQADGYCMWLIWKGDYNPLIAQTIEEYGGILICKDEEQALCFFFSQDVLFASAKFNMWSRFNNLSVTLEVFPARLQVGESKEKCIIFDESLWIQSINPEDGFNVLIHPSLSTNVLKIPGISVIKPRIPEGAADIEWMNLEVDLRLPYQPNLEWYVILRPVGNPLDKMFQSGWREFFSHIETILQRNKFRFTVNNYFLMFPLEGIKQFKNWVIDFITLVNRIKTENIDSYWPCVVAIVDKKGLAFNNELPDKIGLDWTQLSPDYPHMSMQNAMILGDDFSIHKTRFSVSNNTPDDWTCVTIYSPLEEKEVLPQLLPDIFLIGHNPYCFYCGQRSHPTTSCPTRFLSKRNQKIWQEFALLDIDVLQKSVKNANRVLVSNSEDLVHSLIQSSSSTGILINAIYDINWPSQLRAANLFWRMRGKDINKSLKELAPEDNSPIWSLLNAFPSTDPMELERSLLELAHRFPADFRVPSLRGFLAFEMGNIDKAISYWKEAEIFSTFPIIQSWHQYLQGRANEYKGELRTAISIYSSLNNINPTWEFVNYRQIVCEVKLGFAEHILNKLMSFIDENGHYFNKCLIDPELERGHMQIFACLKNLWAIMEERSKLESKNLEIIRDDLSKWFAPGDLFSEEMAERIDKITNLGNIKNYMAFQSLVKGRIKIERELKSHITQQSKSIRDRFIAFTDRLKAINEESAWFPFPSVIKDFTKNCNLSVANLNWVLRANFNLPESFRKAQLLVEEEKERLSRLEKRLKILKVVRDTTLFCLSMAEAFFWIEFAGVIIIFVLLPLVLVYGDKVGLDIAANLVKTDRWRVQKTLFILITILAATISALRTVISFEKIRSKILLRAKGKVFVKK